jgi:hypothetical protein
MATFKDRTIADSYDTIVKRTETYAQAGTRIMLMTDTNATEVNTGLYLEGGGGENVGIGASSPAAKLQVHGTGSNVVRISDDGSTTQLDVDISAGAYGLIGMNTNHALHFQTNNGIRQTILADGKVGIGTTTPSYQLEVHGNASDVAYFSLLYGQTDADIDADEVMSEIRFTGLDASATSKVGAKIRAAADANWSTDDERAPTRLQFYTQDNSDDDSLGSARMTISDGGEVGIGTTNPTSVLDVVGSASAGTGSTKSGLTVYSDQNGTQDEPLVVIHADNAAFDQEVLRISNDGAAKSFQVLDGGTEVFTIADGGNIGIGTDDPQTLLHLYHTDATTHAKTNNMHDFHMVLHNNTVTTDAFAGIAFDVSTETDLDSISGAIKVVRSTQASTTAGRRDSRMVFCTNAGGTADGECDERMVINRDGFVGIGATAPGATLHVQSQTGTSAWHYFYSDAGEDNADKWYWHVAEAGSMYWGTYTGGSWDNILRLSTAGALHGEGGITVAATDVDYAEYFETSDGKAIAKGTSVVLVDGKIRPAVDGESPFGVVRPTDSSAVIAGLDAEAWQGKYLRDEFGSTIYEDYDYVNDYGRDKTGSRKKLNPDFDESREHVPRSDRDEWQVVGLVGQVQILKGQPVSSWIKMKSISNTLDLYYIFPCAQVINNNQQGDSSNGQEPESAGSGDSGGDSESSGEDSGGVEADSSDSSDSASGASEASESSSDDGDESSGSSGSDSSDDSEGGSGEDGSGGE